MRALVRIFRFYWILLDWLLGYDNGLIMEGVSTHNVDELGEA